MSNWLMSPREESLWAGRLALDDWAWPVWKSMLMGGGLIALWLIFLGLALVGLIPALRRRWLRVTGLSVTPGHSMGLFFCSAMTFSLTHAVLFSVGVVAYWLNSLIPANTLASMSEFSYKWLSVVGWLFG